jgi:hypothetical protein
MQAPITAKMTITTPNGLSALVTKIVDADDAIMLKIGAIVTITITDPPFSKESS